MTVKNAVEILLDEVLDGGRCSSKQGEAIRTVVHALGFYRPKDCQDEEYAPVRHGKWLICEEENTVDNYGRPVKYAKCSCCGFRWNDLYSVKNYFKGCPNCMAQMDLP